MKPRMYVRLQLANEGDIVRLQNITEIHYCYPSPLGKKRIAFESDIDGTGYAYNVSDVLEFEARPEVAAPTGLLEAMGIVEDLVDGLDANHDGRDGLTEAQWAYRVGRARALIQKQEGEWNCECGHAKNVHFDRGCNIWSCACAGYSRALWRK